MAAEVKYDIYSSTLTKGISSNRYDRGTRFCLVSGLTGSEADWLVAIQSSAAGQNPHPLLTFSSLPLATVEVKRFGPTKMWAWLNYFRRSLQSNLQGIAEFSPGPERDEIFYSQPTSFDSQGVPNGPLHFANEDITGLRAFPPEPYKWTHPTMFVSLPYELEASAMPDVANLTNTVNNSPITFNGFPFPPATLLFLGLSETWIEETTTFGQTLDTLLYHGRYRFQYARGGFVREYAKFTPASPSDPNVGTWSAQLRSIYSGANFVGQFPTES